MNSLIKGSIFDEKYRIVELLQDERFSNSFLAQSIQDETIVRIDIFSQHDVPGERSLIQLESELQPRLAFNHPNIVRLIAFSRYTIAPDIVSLYMVTEHFESVSISTWMVETASKPMQFGQILGILKSVADALTYLHKELIPATSLHPKKLRINSALQVKLPAFSYLTSAQWLRDSSKLSRSTGTDYRYIAPEMVCESGVIVGDVKSDVYLFGILAFELVSGTLPFDGTKETIAQMHLTEPLPDLLRENNLSDWFDKLVLSCMAKVPVTRPFIDNVAQLLAEKISTLPEEELNHQIRYTSNQAVKVLFVEDNKLDQLFLSRLIKSENYPFKFTFATSVEKATQLLKNRSFDIVITDYMLPDGSAMDLLTLGTKLPMLVVTGSDSDQVRTQVFAAGAHECVAKETEQRHLKYIPRLINRTIEFIRLKQEVIELRSKLEGECSAGIK